MSRYFLPSKLMYTQNNNNNNNILNISKGHMALAWNDEARNRTHSHLFCLFICQFNVVGQMSVSSISNSHCVWWHAKRLGYIYVLWRKFMFSSIFIHRKGYIRIQIYCLLRKKRKKKEQKLQIREYTNINMRICCFSNVRTKELLFYVWCPFWQEWQLLFLIRIQ